MPNNMPSAESSGAPQNMVVEQEISNPNATKSGSDATNLTYRQFGHVPKQTMIHLVRAAKVRKEFIDAVRIHRCETCEATSQKKATHKTALPNNYSFNHTVGIDVFEVPDKFQVLKMVCLGATFQLCEIVRFGAGQPSSAECLRALRKRWLFHGVDIL